MSPSYNRFRSTKAEGRNYIHVVTIDETTRNTAWLKGISRGSTAVSYESGRPDEGNILKLQCQQHHREEQDRT
jgi:hypothetical protein